MRLQFVNGDGNTLLLDSKGSNLKLRRLLGTGIPDVTHQTVRTPNRDGETYTGRSILEPRFLIAEISTTELCTWQDESALRRNIATLLNPKLGTGTLTFTPDDVNYYRIPAILERGAGIDANALPDGMLRSLALSFRCFDPAWTGLSRNTQLFAVLNAGLDIPLEVPVDIVGGSVTAIITNAGDLDSFPIITIPGLVVDPSITNDTSGKVLSFSGLTVAAGSSLIVDMDERTAEVGGVSVMQFRTAVSEAWPLEPGANSITIAAQAAGASIWTFSWYTRYAGV